MRVSRAARAVRALGTRRLKTKLCLPNSCAWPKMCLQGIFLDLQGVYLRF